GKLRPRTAYVFGWIYWWARMASVIPSIVNFLTHAPVLGTVMKAIAGIAPQRTLPKFADTTFRRWFTNKNKHAAAPAKRPRVMLWPDTFNNFFLPETLVAGMEVLEAAGFEVIIPRQSLCCGRPLYDFGMLKTAKRMLRNIIESLDKEINEGTPIVGLEPSCVAVFRDELYGLFPNDEKAKKLHNQVFTLAEFLAEQAPDFTVPKLNGEAIVQAHCHHNAIMKMDCDSDLLKKSGLHFDILNSGCCGMAGYFGYEKGRHYDVSVKSGERVLLPAVRKAKKETLIIADGFSCREQIEQQTDRRALHLAEVLHMSLREKGLIGTSHPERYIDAHKLRDPAKRMKIIIFSAAVAALATALIFKMKRNEVQVIK
ncbi:MAG TPA: heterodisulfide reductase-related iron-sulfur binding cluster, partial [Chryseosolibacter sp.]|nr:heterodisulfide reductase-related iron-sulfur binding cluster [Chryseosolibacter sp.]